MVVCLRRHRGVALGPLGLLAEAERRVRDGGGDDEHGEHAEHVEEAAEETITSRGEATRRQRQKGGTRH